MRAETGTAGATPPGATPPGAAPSGATPAGATPAGATPAGATPAGAAPAGARADRFAPYRAALLDWMACAVRGRSEPAARAAAAAGDGLLERVAALGTAGHVLDFD